MPLHSHVLAWLASLRADAVFARRQLAKRKVTSAAAILSLALALGACTSAFRLMDALLFRPLPVAGAERLYLFGVEGIGPGGEQRLGESSEYPLFARLRATVKDSAELIACSYTDRMDLTFGADAETEKANRQYVSGWMFPAFGLRPALGRLFTENDDRAPGAHPYGVLSFDYWDARFGRDPKVLGRTFRSGNEIYEIVGVAPRNFRGTETGTGVDVFVPAMMHPGVTRDDWSWFRTLVQLKPGVKPEPVLAQLRAPFQAFQEERAKGFGGTMTKQALDDFLHQTPVLEPAGSGRSSMQREYRRALYVLGALVFLVLLIACANVANLMVAQAAARAREMALRVSLGARRWRLAQLVMVESAQLAMLAAAIGGVFAWWSAPLVAGMINPPDNPVRLDLPADWRVLGFGVGLAFLVTFLFGLSPALRTSGVQPVNALKGGVDPQSRRRLMYGLVAAQVAFCFLVHFMASLFVATLDRLSNQPTGFAAGRVVTLTTVAREPQQPQTWEQVADRLRATPGVRSVAYSGWPLLDGNGWNGYIALNGVITGETLSYFLGVSPGWRETMKIPLVAGRDFRAGDTYPGAAIVNQAFVRTYFRGQNPVGRYFDKTQGNRQRPRFQIIGVVADARYRNMREPISPTAYVPFQAVKADGAFEGKDRAAFIVRTAAEDPLAIAPVLRKAVPEANPGFRVSAVRTQQELIDKHTVRERLLATLALFFAALALALAAIGLYGVLHYSVIQRRREIGIRMAVGAQASHIARGVTSGVFAMVAVGACMGVGLGMGSAVYLRTLLYNVEATEPAMLMLPAAIIGTAAILAALPPVLRAVRIDPAKMLRAE